MPVISHPSHIFVRTFTSSSLYSAFSKLANRSGITRPARPNTGIFGIPELRDPSSGYKILEERALDRCRRVLGEILGPTRRNVKMVALFDDLSDTLCQVADLSEFVRHCHPDPAHRRAATDAYYNVSRFVETLNTDVDLYRSLTAVLKCGDTQPTDEVDLLTARLFAFDFEQSGIHLDARGRSRFVDTFGKVVELGTEFMEGISRPVTTRPGSNFGRSVRRYLEPAGVGSDSGVFRVYNNYAHVTDEKDRESLYNLYHAHDPHQERTLAQLLRARQELAEIAGFTCYAEKGIQNTFASSVPAVKDFLETVNTGLRPLVEADMASLKKKFPAFSAETFSFPWNVEHFVGSLKGNLALYDRELVKYFSLGDCIQGLNDIVEALFGLTVRIEDNSDEEFWCGDKIFKLGFYSTTANKSLELRGHVYCDFFSRVGDGKPPMDCHFTIRGGRALTTQPRSDTTLGAEPYQTPIIVVSLNLPPVPNIRECHLSPTALENFFHEMGHALHTLMGRTRYQHVTGTRCSTDFAEVPSNLMELYASDFNTLLKIGRHTDSREAPPGKLVRAYLEDKHKFSAIEYQTQVYYSTLDQAFHSPLIKTKDTSQIVRQVQATYHVYPHVTGVSPHLKFGHVVGYGSKYYSYLVAKSVAQELWQKYFADDPLSSQAGHSFYQLVRHGGERRPQLIMRDVLGRDQPVQIMEFANSIVTDLGEKYGRSKNP